MGSDASSASRKGWVTVMLVRAHHVVKCKPPSEHGFRAIRFFLTGTSKSRHSVAVIMVWFSDKCNIDMGRAKTPV